MTTRNAPAWFTGALAARVDRGSTTVDGVPVVWRAWGDRDDPAIVMIHGSGAHGRWWDHVGPLVAAGRRVVAADLSGHGDSGRRDSYAVDEWVEEVHAAAVAAGVKGRRVLVGHSLGAFVALRHAATYAAETAGVLVVDPPVRVIDPSMTAARARIVATPVRSYATRSEAEARWRPAPPQPVLPFVRDHVARTSIRQVGGRWEWKFDPRTFDRPEIAPEAWSRLECPVSILRAEQGMLSVEMADRLVGRLGSRAAWTGVAAGHHVMLDHPLELVAMLEQLIARTDLEQPDPRHGDTT